jgi:hypothetical protein
MEMNFDEIKLRIVRRKAVSEKELQFFYDMLHKLVIEAECNLASERQYNE